MLTPLALALWSSAALADDVQPYEPDWSAVDRRARNTFTAGWITGLSGLGVEVLGLAAGSSELIVLGALGEAVGAPMMAGASLRSRRAAAELGAPVSGAAGYTSWGLWGGGLALNIASASTLETHPDAYAPLLLAGLGCRLASYATAAVQQAMVAPARRRVGLAVVPTTAGGVSLVVGWR